MNFQLEQQGFAVIPGVLPSGQVELIARALSPLLEAIPSAGIRGLAAKAPCVRMLAQAAEIRSLIEPVLGPTARLVRSILFNKSQEANWQVAWHQDLAIAVRERSELEGFTSWSVKDGVPHVQPPAAVLEQMLTVRLHLDDADETNGALWVVPGSHRLGRLSAGEAATVAEREGKQLCAVKAGDALLIRPLILHASRKATSSRPRRVIHLEFAGADLPEPLKWAETAM